MSHIATYATQLQLNPVSSRAEAKNDESYQLFLEALEVVAEEYGGRVEDHITDYFGRQRRCTFGLITPMFSAGLGVDVDPKTGRVSFVFDDYGVSQDLIQTLQSRVVQTFTSMAVGRALTDMNYDVEVEEGSLDPNRPANPRRKVTVRGVM